VADEYEQLLCTARENLLKEANKSASNVPASAVSERGDVDAGASSSVSQTVISASLLIYIYANFFA